MLDVNSLKLIKKLGAEHNKKRWIWIENNGKGIYSEISRANSTYRQSIKDKKYHGKLQA